MGDCSKRSRDERRVEGDGGREQRGESRLWRTLTSHARGSAHASVSTCHTAGTANFLATRYGTESYVPVNLARSFLPHFGPSQKWRLTEIKGHLLLTRKAAFSMWTKKRLGMFRSNDISVCKKQICHLTGTYLAASENAAFRAHSK